MNTSVSAGMHVTIEALGAINSMLVAAGQSASVWSLRELGAGIVAGGLLLRAAMRHGYSGLRRVFSVPPKRTRL